MAPDSPRTIMTVPSSVMLVASLNPTADLRRFFLWTLDSKSPLRDSNWAGEPSDNLDNAHHNCPTSPNQPSLVETVKVSRWRAKGWKKVLANISNLLSNVKWNLTFWKPTNASEAMIIWSNKGKENLRRVAAFWVFGVIKYTAFTSLETYNSWSIKVACDNDDMRIIRENLQTRGILGS